MRDKEKTPYCEESGKLSREELAEYWRQKFLKDFNRDREYDIAKYKRIKQANAK